MKKNHDILIYTKNNCPLCDEAREMLCHLKGRFSLDIKEIDIMTDSVLYERYKNIIPVVVIDGKHTLGGRISEEDLISCLEKEG